MYINVFFSEFLISLGILISITWPLYLKFSFTHIKQLGQKKLFLVCKNFTILVLLLSFFIIFVNFELSIYFHGFSFYSNSFINFFKLLIIFCVILILLSVNPITLSKWVFPYRIFEFFPLVLFNVLGVLSFLSSETFLTAYITLELQSLTLALLFALKYFSKYSSESGLKYFIVSSFSTALLLLGFGSLYGLYGTIHLEQLLVLSGFEFHGFEGVDFFNSFQIILLFGFSLVCISFLIKLGSAPFHMWTLDVYEGSPMVVTLYALIIPKTAYLVFLLKFIMYSTSNISFLYYNLFFYTGIICSIWGSVGALVQTKIKRLLAYSAVANFGYIMLALSNDNLFNLLAAITFLFIYIFVTFSLFLVLLGLHSRVDMGKIKSIFQLSTIINSGNSSLGFVLSIFLFTIASIPPFNMYIAKYFLLDGLLLEGSMHSVCGALVVVLFSVVSCFYYIRLIRLVYFKNINDFFNFIPYYSIQFSLSLLLSFIFFFNIFFFFYPDLFFNIIIYVIYS